MSALDKMNTDVLAVENPGDSRACYSHPHPRQHPELRYQHRPQPCGSRLGLSVYRFNFNGLKSLRRTDVVRER